MGLNHMNGRVQDAVTGRFLSPDPNIPDATSAQSYNRLSYVYNNPLSFIDPSGFLADTSDADCNTSCPDGGGNGGDGAGANAPMEEIVVTASKIQPSNQDDTPASEVLSSNNMPGVTDPKVEKALEDLNKAIKKAVKDKIKSDAIKALEDAARLAGATEGQICYAENCMFSPPAESQCQMQKCWHEISGE